MPCAVIPRSLGILLLLAGARGALAEAWSLEGTPSDLRTGDVVRQGDFYVVLDRPGAPDLVEDGERVLRDRGTGRIAAVRIWGFGPPDPLCAMTDEEVRAVRGVRVEAWNDGVRESLARIDPERTCVTLTHRAWATDPEALPPLSADLRYLVIDGSGRFHDLASLAGLTHLRFLVVRAETCSLAAIAPLRSLRVLEAQCSGVEGDPVPDWPEMRWLDLSGSLWNRIAWPADVSFLRSMPALRYLDLSWTPVEDLRPLDAHAALERLDVSCSDVSRLPRGPLPRLSSLDALAAPVPPEEESRFRAENPRCRFTLHWMERLRADLRGADHLDIVSLMRREPGREILGRTDVEAFLELIEIDETSSRDFHSCMCVGSHELRFYQGDRELVRVSYHHGQALRWAEWPGHADLTERSARSVAEWFAARGYPGPLAEWSREEARRRAARRRMSAVRAVLPSFLLEAFDAAKTWEDLGALLGGSPQDPVERAVVLLRIAGCDEGTWNCCSPLDETVLAELLPAIDAESMAQALGRIAGDGAALNGAARWLFEWGKWARFPPAALEAALPAVAAHALAHPRARNRRRTILTLETIGSPAALAGLHSLLDTPVPLRPLPESEQADVEGQVMYRDPSGDLDRDVPDAELAALVLARAGRRGVLDVFAGLEMPDVAGKTFVRFAAGDRVVHGFRLAADAGRIEVLTDDLRVEAFALPAAPEEVSEADFGEFCAEFLAAKGEDPKNRYSHHEVVEAALLAFWCRQRGHEETADQLLAFADEALADRSGDDRSLPEFVWDLVSGGLRRDAIIAANEGAPRPELRTLWRRIVKAGVGHDTVEAEEMAELYEAMIAEDGVFREPAPEEYAKLPPAERGRILIHRLRDVAVEQGMCPGHVSVFGGDGYGRSPERKNAATELVEIGWDAVPLLIEHLDDLRPTRCHGYGTVMDHNRDYLLRIGDACREVLEEVTGLVLFTPDGRNGTMTGNGLGPEAKRRAGEWWTGARDLSPCERFSALLESADAQERTGAARRLIAADPAAGTAAIVALLATHGAAARPELFAEVADRLGPEHRAILEAGLTAGDLGTLALAARGLWRACEDDRGARVLVERLRKLDERALAADRLGVAAAAEVIAAVDRDPSIEALCDFVRGAPPTLRGEALRVAGRVVHPRMLAALVTALDDRYEPDEWRGYPARWCDLSAEAIRAMLGYGPKGPRGLDEEPRDAYIAKLRAWLSQAAPTLDWDALRRRAAEARAR